MDNAVNLVKNDKLKCEKSYFFVWYQQNNIDEPYEKLQIISNSMGKSTKSKNYSKSTQKERAEACSVEVMEDFHSKLKNAIERLGLENKPENIFNCDEPGFQTDTKKLYRKGTCQSP
ncbi:hypothetical protein CBL_12034 [Carabus blaptoides fortunei]